MSAALCLACPMHEGDEMEQLMTAEQVAEVLNVKPSWLFRAAQAERFPHVKVGRWVRFRPRDVREWIRSGGTADEAE